MNERAQCTSGVCPGDKRKRSNRLDLCGSQPSAPSAQTRSAVGCPLRGDAAPWALQNGSCDSTPFGLPERQNGTNQAVERLLSYGFRPSLTYEVNL
jgi:hypothetical protein